MITGVVAQGGGRVVPRGTFAPVRAYVDVESIYVGVIARAGDQLMSLGAVVVDGDVFYGAALPRILTSASPVVDGDHTFAPIIAGSQVIEPRSLRISEDLVYLPKIEIPGELGHSALLIDVDVVFSASTYSPGSLRPQLVGDVESVEHGMTVTQPSTMRPTVVVADADVFYSPSRFTSVRTPFPTSVDSDVVYQLVTTSSYGAVLFQDNDVFYAPISIGFPATFDGVATNVTLTGGNLIATHSNTTSNSGARSLALKSAGKFYFEVTMVVTTGTNDCSGVLLSAGSYTNLVTNGTNCTVVYKSTGNISSNNSSTGKTLGALVVGDIISWAIDLNSRRAWARKNGGNWNGDASANPVTGGGSVAIASSSSMSPAVGFGGTGTLANDQQTGNFGQSAFAYAAPTDFGKWV